LFYYVVSSNLLLPGKNKIHHDCSKYTQRQDSTTRKSERPKESRLSLFLSDCLIKAITVTTTTGVFHCFKVQFRTLRTQVGNTSVYSVAVTFIVS